MKEIFELNNQNIEDNLIWGKSIGICYAYIEVTERCNANCVYCQIDKPRQEDMDFELYKKIIEELIIEKVFEVRLGGGEPLLCNRIIEMIQYASNRGIAVWICTNGYYLDKNLAKKMKEAGCVGVKISLDSVKESVHDNLRGKGSFNKAVLAIQKAHEEKLLTMINFTMGESNIDEYDAMTNMGKEMGCVVSPHFIMPVGRGKQYHIEHDLKRVFTEKQNAIIRELSGDTYCTAGTDMIAIAIDGEVRPCLYGNKAGNLREMSLKKIKETENFIHYLTRIPNSRACYRCNFNKICIEDRCPIEFICRGGCWFFYDENNID